MEAIQQSRLLRNLWRDLNNDYKPDESLSILNASGQDIEVTDNTTGVTKIIFPRTILHTNRPHSSITIIQNKHPDDEEPLYSATIKRNQIKKQFISIETPIKYESSTESYAELLSLSWFRKVSVNTDTILITPHKVYYIEGDFVNDSNHVMILLILLILILVCIVCILI